MMETIIKEEVINEKAVEATEEINSFCEQLVDIRDQIAKLSEHKEALEKLVKEAFGDAGTLVFNDQVIATYRLPKDTMYFDAKSFQEDHPDMAKEYMKPKKGGRRFILK